MDDELVKRPRRRRLKAGKQLRASVDAVLTAEAARVGKNLAWSPVEQSRVDSAVQAAEHAELLQLRLDAELARDEPRMTLAASLVAEIRLQRKAVAEHLTAVPLLRGAADGKSATHQAAAQARWGPGRPMRRVK